ncbi:MAG: WD40 repeat domain-containing protein [Minicystis sp.]
MAVLAACAPAPGPPPAPPLPASAKPPVSTPPAAPPARVEVRVERDHDAAVQVAAFRPDGGAVAFAAEVEVRVWPLAGAAPLRAMRAPAVVRAIGWAGSDRVVAVTDAGATAWEIGSGAARELVTGGTEEKRLDLVLSGNGMRLARMADASAGVVEILDTGTGAVLRVLRTGMSKAAIVGFYDEDRAVAVLGERGLSVWDVAAGTLWAQCAACAVGEHGSRPDLSPDGRTAAIERERETRGERIERWLEVRDVATGRERARIKAWGGYDDPLQPASPVRMGIAWSPDGRRAVIFTEVHFAHSPANSNSGKLFDTATWRAITGVGGFGGPCAMPEPTYAFSADSAVLRFHDACAREPAVALMDGRTGAPRGKLRWPSYALWWSPDGKRVAEASESTFSVRDVTTGATVTAVDGASERASVGHADAAFRPDGGALATLPGPVVWDLGRGAMAGTGAGVVPFALSWSPDARRLFFGGDDAALYGYDVVTGDRIASPSGDEETSAASPDGASLVIVRSCARRQGDSCLGVTIAGPTGARRPIAELPWDRMVTALSPDGALIAIGGDRHDRMSADGSKVTRPGEHQVRILRSDTGTEVGRIPDQDTVSRLAFSPDGRRLLVARSYSGASVWSIGASPARAFEVPSQAGAAFSRDGRVLVVGLDAGAQPVRLLDAGDGKVLTELALAPDLVNRRAFIERDLAAIVTAEIAAQPARLQHVLDLAPRGGGAAHLGPLFAISPDLSLAVRGKHDLELVRVNDGRAVHLVSFRAGGRVRVVFDDEGRFDGDAASIARVRLRSPDTNGAWISAGPFFEAHRRPGLLRDFVAAAR